MLPPINDEKKKEGRGKPPRKHCKHYTSMAQELTSAHALQKLQVENLQSLIKLNLNFSLHIQGINCK